MLTSFYKYQGAGNDFVLIDNRAEDFKGTAADIAKICHRRFGVGADGLMLLQNLAGYDFEMIYFNADGRASSMCGNGGRCITAFAARLGIVPKTENTYYFMAVDGAHDAQILANAQVSLAMQDVDFQDIAQPFENCYTLNTGSPHYVAFVDNLDNIDVARQGAAIRYSEPYLSQGGINVNFVSPQIIDNQLNSLNLNSLNLATYERGVEAPTYACGTGATAAALAYHVRTASPSPIRLLTEGGALVVSFDTIYKENSIIIEKFVHIRLIGGAEFVFSGTLVI
jgi:diaminopimelate epimerase